MTALPVKRANDLCEQPLTQKWLVGSLWLEGAVGIIGGEPKCCKSYLALQMAVAVATGKPLLNRFDITRPGPVLLYAAEDALHVVRYRLENLAAHVGVNFSTLDVHVITIPTLRLDHQSDRECLEDTVKLMNPRLLLLDPFVRLHRIDENASREVAPILAYLRGLQRAYDLSVVLVHHAKKGGSHIRAGQALRGSSEFHAWGDSNIYLRRRNDLITLNVEHRAAGSIDELIIKLTTQNRQLALKIVEKTSQQLPQKEPLEDRILSALRTSDNPISSRLLRLELRVNMNALNQTLQQMSAARKITKSKTGYQLPVTVIPAP